MERLGKITTNLSQDDPSLDTGLSQRPLYHEVPSSGQRLNLFVSKVRILLSSCTQHVARVTKKENSLFHFKNDTSKRARLTLRPVHFALPSPVVSVCSVRFLPYSVQRRSFSCKYSLQVYKGLNVSSLTSGKACNLHLGVNGLQSGLEHRTFLVIFYSPSR